MQQNDCQLETMLYEYILHQKNELEIEYIQLLNNVYRKNLCSDDYLRFIEYTIKRDVKLQIFEDIQNLVKSYGTNFYKDSGGCHHFFRNQSPDGFYI